MRKGILWMLLSFLLVAALVLASCGEAVPGEQEEEEEEEEEEEAKKPGDGLVVYFQMGGAPGMPCSDPGIGGATLAAEIWGVELILQSGEWKNEKEVEQFREAVAARPDGIVLVGMMGEDAALPLVEEALDLGIAVAAYHWGLPACTEKFAKRGYADFKMDFFKTGVAHAQATIDAAGLVAGDRVLLYDHLGPYPRIVISEGIIDTLEEAGILCDWIVNPGELILDIGHATSVIAGYIAAHPDTDAVIVWHGIFTAEAETILRGCGFTDPDDIWFTGADINPETIEALESGWLDLIGDGMLSQQAFLAVQQVILTTLYKVPGLPVLIDPQHHTWEDIKAIKHLIEVGLR